MPLAIDMTVLSVGIGVGIAAVVMGLRHRAGTADAAVTLLRDRQTATLPQLDAEQIAATRTALYHVPLVDRALMERTRQARLEEGGWDKRLKHRAPEPPPAEPAPVEEQTTVEVHQGATEQWSPVAEVGSLPNGDLDPGEDRPGIDELTADEIEAERWEQEFRLFREAGARAAAQFERGVVASGATDIPTIRDAEIRHGRAAAHAALSAGTFGDTEAIDARAIRERLAAGEVAA